MTFAVEGRGQERLRAAGDGQAASRAWTRRVSLPDNAREQTMENRFRELISRNLLDGPGRVLLARLGDGDSLIEAGLLDSLSVVQLVGLLEKELDIVFDPLDVELQNLESIERISQLVASKLPVAAR